MRRPQRNISLLTTYVPVKSKFPPRPGATPRHLIFVQILVQIPPSRGRKAVQMPHQRSIPGDQMPPPRKLFGSFYYAPGSCVCKHGLIDNTLTCQR